MLSGGEDGATMVEFRSDIDAALSGDGPIPKARVISWIEAATDSDLSLESVVNLAVFVQKWPKIQHFS